MPGMSGSNNTEVAVFGGGCFWCTEAVFGMLRGVASVIPGYAGGAPPANGKAPTYGEVCSGRTGHAEVVKIESDPGASAAAAQQSWSRLIPLSARRGSSRPRGMRL